MTTPKPGCAMVTENPAGDGWRLLGPEEVLRPDDEQTVKINGILPPDGWIPVNDWAGKTVAHWMRYDQWVFRRRVSPEAAAPAPAECYCKGEHPEWNYHTKDCCARLLPDGTPAPRSVPAPAPAAPKPMACGYCAQSVGPGHFTEREGYPRLCKQRASEGGPGPALAARAVVTTVLPQRDPVVAIPETVERCALCKQPWQSACVPFARRTGCPTRGCYGWREVVDARLDGRGGDGLR